MYLYMHDTYWYVLAGVRVYDVGGALAMASAVQGATIRQRRPRHAARASAHLPRPPTLAGPAAALGAARSGAETHDETVAYGSRGIRVASEPTVGRDGLSSGAKPARRRAATATEAEGSVVWTRRCLRLLAAVSYRVL